MEIFSYLPISDTREGRTYKDKGFEWEINYSFDSVGSGLISGYVYRCLTSNKWRYGLQLLISCEQLTPKLDYPLFKNFISALAQNPDDLDISQFWTIEFCRELERLGKELTEDQTFLEIQQTLREYSRRLNVVFVVFHQEQDFEIDETRLPRPSYIGFGFTNNSRIKILSTNREIYLKKSNQKELLEYLVYKCSLVLKNSSITPCLKDKINKYLPSSSDSLRQSFSDIPVQTLGIKISPAPNLRSLKLNFSTEKKDLKILPHSIEDTEKFLKEFKDNSLNNSNYLQNREVFDKKKPKLKPPKNPERKPMPSASNPSSSVLINSGFNPFDIQVPNYENLFSKIFKSNNSKQEKSCENCGKESNTIPDLIHSCILCRYCYSESALVNCCMVCNEQLQNNDINLIKLMYEL